MNAREVQSLLAAAGGNFVKKLFKGIAIIGVIVLVAAIALYMAIPPQQSQTKELTTAPVSLPVLAKSFKSGKPTVLLFEGPGCSACKKQRPIWEDVKEVYDGKVNFIDLMYNISTAKAFEDYKIKYIPTLYFITRDGKILDMHVGLMSYDNLVKAVENLLKD